MGTTEQNLATRLAETKEQVSNVDKDPAILRKELAEKEAKVICDWLKEVIAAGITVAQDGGANFKTTILSKLNS